MSTHVKGGCPNCEKTLVYLSWCDGKILVIVECSICGDQISFNLQKLQDALGVNKSSTYLEHSVSTTIH